MAKVIKTFSINPEVAAIIELQPNQSKAVEDAIIALFSKKKNGVEDKGTQWVHAFDAVSEEIEATYNGKKLTPTKALQILNRLRAVSEPNFKEKVSGELPEFYAACYASVVSFLKDTIAGKAPNWADATK